MSMVLFDQTCTEKVRVRQGSRPGRVVIAYGESLNLHLTGTEARELITGLAAQLEIPSPATEPAGDENVWRKATSAEYERARRDGTPTFRTERTTDDDYEQVLWVSDPARAGEKR